MDTVKKRTILLLISIAALILGVSASCAGDAYEFEIEDTRTYGEKSEYWSLDIAVPRISGMADASAQQELNAYFLSKADEVLAEYRQSVLQAAESIAAGNQPNFAYQYRYDVVTDSDDFFVIKTTSFYRSSSVTDSSEYWTLDKTNGRLLDFRDVVKTSGEMADIREQIYLDMLRFNNDAGVPIFRTGDSSLPEALAKSGEKHHWYFSDAGNLVITFDKFELGPGILGSPEFIISYSTFFYTHK